MTCTIALAVRKKTVALLAVCCLATGALASTPVLAQSNGSTADGPTHVATVNPFFLLAGWISAEYEQRLNSSIGLGGGVSYVEFDDTRYTNFEVKGRLYPNEHAMRGFGFAVSLGVTQLKFKQNNGDCIFPPLQGSSSSSCADTTKNATSPAVGIEFGYQWLLGSHRRTAIDIGVGGKRFLASKSSLSGTSTVIPTYRLGVGYAW